jgi:hypothetical protein
MATGETIPALHGRNATRRATVETVARLVPNRSARDYGAVVPNQVLGEKRVGSISKN